MTMKITYWYCKVIVVLLPLAFCLWSSPLVNAGFTLVSPPAPFIQTCRGQHTRYHQQQQQQQQHADRTIGSISCSMAVNNNIHDDSNQQHAGDHHLFEKVERRTTGLLAASWSLALLTLWSLAAAAADFAGLDISGQDFSNQDLHNQDFTGVVAKGTVFRGSNLQGAMFAKANLQQADFGGANLQSANFVDALLDGSVFKDVLAQRAKFSSSILDVADFENVDLTDSMWPSNLVRRRIVRCCTPCVCWV
jgi:uncharacterized protein YjbI with pentapeptide repeats